MKGNLKRAHGRSKILFFCALITTFLLIDSLQASEIRVATYNIRNFDYDNRSNTPTNKEALKDLLKRINFDILSVQEIREKSIFQEFVSNNFPKSFSTHLSRCGGSFDQHLGFIVNRSVFDVIEFSEDERTVREKSWSNTLCSNGSRPVSVLKVLHLEKRERIAFVAVHLKAGGNRRSIAKRFYQIKEVMDLKRELTREGFKKVIVLGDFNTTEYLNRDNKLRNRFERELKSARLTNLTEDLDCSSYWWGNRDDNQFYPSKLDHIIASEGTKLVATPQTYGHCRRLSCQITHEGDMRVSFDEISDHCPISVDLRI